MAYIVPRAEITQQFLASPVFTDSPLPALILGPNFKLSRYAVASEKANTKVVHPSDTSKGNAYQSGADVAYVYPGAAVDVDLSYNKVFIEDAQVQVFPNTTLSSPSAAVTRVASFTNRILAGINLKTANSTTRHAVFSNRDVQVGDVVVVTDSVSSDVLTTKVKSLVATIAAASVGSTTADAGNTGDDVAGQITAGGTYTGTKNITYKLTVERGGGFYTGSNAATCARLKITSNDVDSSATVNITDDAVVAVGTYGVTATITEDGTDNTFTAGDSFYIAATAAAPSTVRTIELEDNLTTAQLDGGASLTMEIRLVKSGGTELPAIRSLEANTTNWTATASTLTVKSGATMTDSAIVNGSDLVALPVKGGGVYVQHRDLLSNYSTSIGSVSSLADVTAKLGVVHVDNPLAQGVYDALLNAADTAVYFASVPTNDLAGYNKVVELARKDNKYYSVVPLTFDATIQDAIVGHVNAMSVASVAKWRIAWLAKQMVATKLVYSAKTDGSSWTGTITDDPTVSGTQYTLATVAGASFVTDGVRVGDSLLYNFRLDSNGAVINDTATIAEIRSQTTLVLSASVGVAFTSAKVQVRRNYTVDEQVANLAAAAGGFNNRRVRSVFPDTFKAGSQTKEGFYLAASLAGLRSGVVPHQGLTNIQLLGPTELSRVVNELSEEQLNTLAEAGVWIVTQSALGATPYTRHQLTTDESGLNFSEDSVTTNVDHISYALQAKIAPFIGLYNVNPGTILQIRSAIDAELSYRMTSTFTARAGNQLNGFTITKVEQNATFKDRIDVEIVLQVPAPINVIKINLTV